MIRKYLFVALAILPLMVLSQDKRVVITTYDNYENNHRKKFVSEVFRDLAGRSNFVKKIFHRQGNFLHELRDRLPFTKNRHINFAYTWPIFDLWESRTNPRDPDVLVVPYRKGLDQNRNVIKLKRNGRTIYITRNTKFI